MKSRRQLLAAACTLVAATSPFAQPSARMRVIGVLGSSGTDLFRFFVAALAERGWIEGRTVTFVYRGAGMPVVACPASTQRA